MLRLQPEYWIAIAAHGCWRHGPIVRIECTQDVEL
jgi:hypothetical protein